MNKAARMIAMSGMAAVAALAFSAGPAAAASASAASPAPSASKSTTSAAEKQSYRARVVNYYRSPIACNKAGRFGEWRNSWDDYTCYRVPFGFKRGWWALSVRWDNHGFPGHGHGPGFPGGPGHGPGFPGGPGHGPGFPGGPGHPGPHFPAKK
ncbi:hypothetical protein [Actinoplanes sp. NPDC026619]|uniref:hypothetical protein n=1 Tax=Actinoplanes sp. NPDC026619 TaxID=3155798 RepID=UPI0033F856BC